MAEILLNRRQFRDALEQYQLAARLTNRKDMVLSCLINSGEILLDSGDYDAADIEFAAALQIDPDNNTALQLRQQTSKQKSSKSR